MNDNDPRLGLPSGSSALEDSLCPGRWRAQKDWTAIEIEVDQEPAAPGDELDRDAEAGKRIHKIYAGESCLGATEPEKQRALQGLEVDLRMTNRWIGFFKGDPEVPIVTMREHRWWLKDDDGNKIYSGQTDLVKIRGLIGTEADVLVGDLKGLWGYHDEATINQQLRRYIALIAVNLKDLGYSGIRSACAYLNQPAKSMDPVLATYDAQDIETAVMHMHFDIAAIMDPDAPRVAGPVQCHHCKAKLFCEEYQKAQVEVIAPIFKDSGPIVHINNDTVGVAIERLSGQKLAEILPWLPVFDHVIALAKSEAKRRLRLDPLSVPGYRLKKNAPRSKVTDLMELWKRIFLMYPGTTADEFIRLCSITKTNVEETVRSKSGLKGKALSEKLDEILDGCTAPVYISDSLEEGEPEPQ